MDGGSWYCTEGSDQDHPEGREMKTDKMVVWGGLTESCERKRSKRQRRKGKIYPFSSVVVSTLCDPLDCSTPGLPVRHQLLEFTQTHVHWVSEAIQPSHPLSSLLLPPSIFPSIMVFSRESVLHIRWPKYWSFSFSISPSNEYSGLISFRMDWLDLFAAQGTLKSLLQHHSSKASILQRSAFFMVQLSHPPMTTGKTTALTRQTFVSKGRFLSTVPPEKSCTGLFSRSFPAVITYKSIRKNFLT